MRGNKAKFDNKGGKNWTYLNALLCADGKETLFSLFEHQNSGNNVLLLVKTIYSLILVIKYAKNELFWEK